MSDSLPMLSIVVPTYHEADNVALLTERIFKTERHAVIPCELMLVYDISQDGGVETVDHLQAS